MLECLKKDDEDGALLEIEDDLTCQICFGYIMISGKQCTECEKILCETCHKKQSKGKDSYDCPNCKSK